MNKMVYQRPSGSRRSSMQITRYKERPVLDTEIRIAKPVIVHGSTECHVTPPRVAELMATLLVDNIGFSKEVLDPQVGTGNLIQALLDAGFNLRNLHGVERQYDLVDTTRSRFEGLSVTHRCFLDFSNDSIGCYDGVITNPPFSHVRQHMIAAEQVLKPRGVIVALVPVSFERDGYREIKLLDENTFATAKVRTKVVLFQS
ncbi:methyltransferase [Vibrio vulnificus]